MYKWKEEGKNPGNRIAGWLEVIREVDKNEISRSEIAQAYCPLFWHIYTIWILLNCRLWKGY
jgi:hypothetical protein